MAAIAFESRRDVIVFENVGLQKREISWKADDATPTLDDIRDLVAIF